VERGNILMVSSEQQLTSLRHYSRACRGILSRWFNV